MVERLGTFVSMMAISALVMRSPVRPISS
jgi:hypothetical protein